jgi:hypothetical protein
MAEIAEVWGRSWRHFRPGQLTSFAAVFASQHHHACRWDDWEAGALRDGGLGDDSFDEIGKPVGGRAIVARVYSGDVLEFVEKQCWAECRGQAALARVRLPDSRLKPSESFGEHAAVGVLAEGIESFAATAHVNEGVLEVPDLPEGIAGVQVQRRIHREKREMNLGLLEIGFGQAIRDRERTKIPLELFVGIGLQIGQRVRDRQADDARVSVDLGPQIGQRKRRRLTGSRPREQDALHEIASHSA